MALEQNEKCPVQIADLVVLADYLVISQDEEQAFDLDGIVGIYFLYGNVGNHFNAHVFYFILKNSIPVDRVKTRLVLQDLDQKLSFMNLCVSNF